MQDWPSPFDPRVVFAAAGEADLAGYALHPAEAALLGPQVVAARRLSFTLGRAAAAAALARLGCPPLPVLSGERQQPLWPEGVTGSIAHTGAHGVAAVGWRRDVAGLGVDLEAADRMLQHDIARRICTPAELEWVEAGDPRLRNERVLRLFGAKEAVYKAFYPLERTFLGFRDVTLSWVAPDLFDGVLHKQAARGYPEGARFEVRSLLVAGMVVSGVQLA